MAFSTEEILNWFCATTPLPSGASDDEVLPKPGDLKYKREKDVFEAASLQERDSHYERVSSMLQQSTTNHQEPPRYNTAYYDEDDEIEEFYVEDDDVIGSGKPLNPAAHPGDDDYYNDALIYGKYSFDVDDNPHLPIASHREAIMETIEANQVTVIQGKTGSGKSTQVAQYILDHCRAVENHCNIVCTQPRRIAATSIARFVAERRGWPIGTMVGYQIALDRVVSEDTRILFCTTGVLLEKLVNMKNMNQFTHVILDEVHERDKDTDFCLLVVRKLLRTNSKHVKVILMSATIDADVFAYYFGSKSGQFSRIIPAPVLRVEGMSYNVTEFYLDDVRHIGECQQLSVENPRITEDGMQLVCRLIKNFELVEQEDSEYSRGDFVHGTVLVFLPGLPEIKEMESRLDSSELKRNLSIQLLHSSINSEEQAKVFYKPEVGKRKVILATNIAESSITVPDIKFVIDFCLVKQLMCDLETNYTCLRTVWCSRASLDQRKGRAGRTSSGRCYRLITRDFLGRHIPDYSTPEMQRCPLESLVLKAKKLDMGEPRAILSWALQPPSLNDIERAILTLKEVGAISITHGGKVNPYNGELTLVGEILESIPVDVKLGKLLILGHAFGCLEECLIIAAALSLKSFFANPSTSDEIRGYRSKMSWANGSFCDCVAIVNAYKEWLGKKLTVWRHQYSSMRNAEREWCKRNLIHKNTINEVSELVKELTGRLAQFGIKPVKRVLSRRDSGIEDMLTLKLVLCGAFYPNFFRWGESDEEQNQKIISGHNLTTTVMVGGLPPDGMKYAKQICSLFNDCGRGKALHFQGSKVYVEFERPRPDHHHEMSAAVQPVLESVYLALKKKHERRRMVLYEQRLESSREEEVVDDLRKPSPTIVSDPSVVLVSRKLPESGRYQIVVTEIIDAGHFWAQFSDTTTHYQLRELMTSISRRALVPLVASWSKLAGTFCLAKFSEDGQYYRAKVENYNKYTDHVQVLYVDYGNVEWVPRECLCEMSESEAELPMQAFECFLTSVKPAYNPHCSDGQWSRDAALRFRDLCIDKNLIAKVYSEVDGVLRVELYDTHTEEDILINEVLVREHHAMKCEEPYQSRLRHAQVVYKASQSEASGSSSSVLLDIERRGPVVEIPRKSTSTTVDWIQSHSSSDTRYYQRGGARMYLRGPESPYEVTFYSLTKSGGFRPVKIERMSVNSIAVNNEPQDNHERMMVAAHVALNPAGNTCLARTTTLMPNIHGLLHLVTLLFAPSIEMRTDELRRQYTGALCGLGFDPDTRQSIYFEHDVELIFDTLITQDDLQCINYIRRLMNIAVGDCSDVIGSGEHDIRAIQKRARSKLRELILSPRESVTPFLSPDNGRGWNQVPVESIVSVDTSELAEESPVLFTYHSGIAISGERIDKQRSARVLMLREKMKELRKKVSDSTEHIEITCDLCNFLCASPFELKLHLTSVSHSAAERDLFSDDIELDKSRESLQKLSFM